MCVQYYALTCIKSERCVNFKLEYQEVFWDLRLGFCSKKYIKTEENEVHNKITGKIFLPSGRCGFSEIDFLVRKIANPSL